MKPVLKLNINSNYWYCRNLRNLTKKSLHKQYKRKTSKSSSHLYMIKPRSMSSHHFHDPIDVATNTLNTSRTTSPKGFVRLSNLFKSAFDFFIYIFLTFIHLCVCCNYFHRKNLKMSHFIFLIKFYFIFLFIKLILTLISSSKKS